MRSLALWNFEQTAGQVYRIYDGWALQVGREECSGAKVVKPLIVGYHGLNRRAPITLSS